MLRGKNILLGVTGSIAAYKSAILVRLLIKSGANVKVMMTESAKDFITPVTLATLSKNPVLTDYYENKEEGTWTNHVDLGNWADLFIIAPASANTIANLASGKSNNLFLTTYLSARNPVWVCPAMDLEMYRHASVQENLKTLRERGNHIIEATEGELASGLHGQGRMEEPENIYAAVEAFFDKPGPLAGKKVLITAGPTHEAIDPVRFIGNRSSGKMGIALANHAASLGADVHLVCGPVRPDLEVDASVERVDVESALEMKAACDAIYDQCDVAILSAAVADYRVDNPAGEKIKKTGENLPLNLTKNPDILAGLGERKKHQILVGFALETQNEQANAKDKLERKNLDLIVLNSLRDEGAGFNTDTNRVTLIDRKNNSQEFPLKSKEDVARDVWSKVIELLP
jgi:phosphopantothenoylcysteine decarboxylase/phosphopantothenate--cysteine ligase